MKMTLKISLPHVLGTVGCALCVPDQWALRETKGMWQYGHGCCATGADECAEDERAEDANAYHMHPPLHKKPLTQEAVNTRSH